MATVSTQHHRQDKTNDYMHLYAYFLGICLLIGLPLSSSYEHYAGAVAMAIALSIGIGISVLLTTSINELFKEHIHGGDKK